MTTLQEYLNQKYPTKENKERVREIDNVFGKDKTRELEGGELDLREFANLEVLIVNGSVLKTPLTK